MDYFSNASRPVQVPPSGNFRQDYSPAYMRILHSGYCASGILLPFSWLID
jgi:hypothetical protein